jgi:hypothetical protein
MLIARLGTRIPKRNRPRSTTSPSPCEDEAPTSALSEGVRLKRCFVRTNGKRLIPACDQKMPIGRLVDSMECFDPRFEISGA